MKTYTLGCPPGSRLIVWPDLHFPVTNMRALALVQEVCEALGVTDSVLQGDVFDVFGLSTHPKEAKQMFKHGRLADEVDASRSFRAWSSRQFRTQTFIPGNHEARVQKFQAAFPALLGIPWQRFLELDTWEGLEVLEYGDCVRVGPLQIEHGDKAKGSLRGPQEVLRNHPHQLTMYGHTHRAGSAYRTRWNYGSQELYGAWNVGTLVDFDLVEYETRPDWQLAFGLVDVYQEGGKVRVDPEVVVIHNEGGRLWCRARGKTFRG